MSGWTTHCRIPAQQYRQADQAHRDALITGTEQRVRTTLRAATDHDTEVTTGWAYVIPSSDPTASEFHLHGETSVQWTPGQDVPETAAELRCRGRTVT
jgi:hypothetical protein